MNLLSTDNYVYVTQNGLKILDSNENNDLISKYFSNCIAVIIYNIKNKERALFHAYSDERNILNTTYYDFQQNMEKFKLFIDKSDKKDLQAFIIKASNNSVNGVFSSLLRKNDIPIMEKRVNQNFNVRLTSTGIVKIDSELNNNIEEFNITKNSNFEENHKSIKNIVENEFIESQLQRLECFIAQMRNEKNIVKTRIYESSILKDRIKQKRTYIDKEGKISTINSYFDILNLENTYKNIPFFLNELFSNNEEIITKILETNNEINVIKTLCNNDKKYSEKIFYIFRKYISVREIFTHFPFSLEQANILDKSGIEKLVLAGKLNIEQALELTIEKANILDKYSIRELVLEGKLNIEQALELTIEKANILDKSGIKKLVLEGKFNIEQALELTIEKANILDKSGIEKLVLEGKLNIEQALELTIEKANILDKSGIRELVLADKLNIEQALELTVEKANILDKSGIRDLVLAGKLNIEQALELAVEKTNILVKSGIQE